VRSPAAPVVALLVATGIAVTGLAATPGRGPGPGPTPGLAATAGVATTAYVSDDLVLGVYADKDPQSTRLATLHSGALLYVLATEGDYSRVRLGDGKIGWARSSFLVTREPAVVRVKELEEEINRSRAATPELTAAATGNEIEQLKGELAQARTELQSARATGRSAQRDLNPAGRSVLAGAALALWPFGLGVLCVGLLLGFLLGYRFLAHRVRQKFGGIKVY
jgi:hypothetical protein